ncbi:MAG: type II toxin-antitoxin system HicB family antitoxin [Trueperaceae bacterium]|nr:type II toxin-antitoxin system HicB family antitoxin [Trueperaceae bacterium]
MHETAATISLHVPYPGNDLKRYQVELVLDTLTQEGLTCKDMMEHKGYLGSVHYSAEDHVFYGKVAYVRSLITFEGTDVASLEKAFVEAVDDYLETCHELGKEPETPFKGTFNVRTGQERHRRASVYALTHDKSLNQVVNEALDVYRGQDDGEGVAC